MSVLRKVCGSDDELYGFTSSYLCVNPLATVSSETLDDLMKEAEKSGDYRPALGKALFEASQRPEQTEKYEGVVRDIAARTITATEQEIVKVEQQGLLDRAAFLKKRIEDQKTLQQRAGDILDAAARYYGERVLEMKEEERKAERIAEIREAEGHELSEELEERTEREARKRERKGMGRAERKQAELQEEKEQLAAEERKKAREAEEKEAELAEQKIEEQEEQAREERLEHLNRH